MNRHVSTHEVMWPGGIPYDYHPLPEIKPNFFTTPQGLEVNEASYEEYCDAVAEFRSKRQVVVDE